MTDAKFGNWFAETGHKWRGWPEWNDDEIATGTKDVALWYIHFGLFSGDAGYRWGRKFTNESGNWARACPIMMAGG